MPILNFTAKEIHILIQLILLMKENGIAFNHAKQSELETLRNKLQSVKGV